MSLIEEEHQLRHRQISGLGQTLEQLRQQPQQQRGIDLRRLEQPVSGEDVHHAVAVRVGLEKVVEIERGLGEEFFATLLFEHEQVALDGPDAGGGDVAVFVGELRGVLSDELQHRAQILEVEQQQALRVGDAEHEVQHARLRFVELKQAREQQRPHLADGRANGMALFAEDIPERDGTGGRFEIFEAELPDALPNFRRVAARLADAAQVALHVREKHRHTSAAEALGEKLEGDGLARAGRARDEAVAIGHLRQEKNFGAALGDENRFAHAPVMNERGAAINPSLSILDGANASVARIRPPTHRGGEGRENPPPSPPLQGREKRRSLLSHRLFMGNWNTAPDSSRD